MKISVVGLGQVGSATAHALLLNGVGSEIVLVNRTHEKALGDALDLTHAGAMLPKPPTIYAGGVAETAGSDLIILTLSVPTERYGRKLLAEGNAKLFSEVVPALAKASPYATFLVVTNPVDALTWHVLQITDLPPERVIGTGTVIDSARLRVALSKHYKVHPNDLRVYVLGEHGETQVPAISVASTGGTGFDSPETALAIFQEAKHSPIEVFNYKGYTNFAVAQSAVMVAECIELDELHTLPVSAKIDGYLGVTDVCASLPCILGRRGITRQLYPELSPEEQKAFIESCNSIRETIALMK